LDIREMKGGLGMMDDLMRERKGEGLFMIKERV
jgi:hypothetical protein